MKRLLQLGGVMALLVGALNPALAAPPLQVPDGEEYIVQAGDWLTKIADKYYGDPFDYIDILEATNIKAGEDSSFPLITDPNFIEVGQKLWVPLKQGPDVLNVSGQSFQPVTIERLGFSTVVPAVWSPLGSSDPLLAHAWGTGPLSFVSFTTTPGNDALVGMAQLLGANPEDLTNDVLGGQLSEIGVGDQTWTVYTRDDGKLASVVAGTVLAKVIYQVSLFVVSNQKDVTLNTILENFEITDPSLAQQNLTLLAPTAGTSLTNPFELRGSTTRYPFRGRLIYRVLDAQGNQVGRGPFEVVGQLGNPATFSIPGLYDIEIGGPGIVEVAEVSATDGTIIAIDSVAVELVADPDGYGIIIDDPSAYASVKSPVQIRGKTTDKPFDNRLNYRIVDANGTEISRGVLQSSGESGEVNLFDGFADYTVTANGPGRVEVFDIRPADGAVFTIGTVNVWLTNAP